MNFTEISNDNSEETGFVTVNFALFENADCNWELVEESLQAKWGMKTRSDVVNDGVEFSQGDMKVYLSFVASPVPNEEATINAEKNILWQEAVETTAKHRAHMIIAVLGGKNIIEHKILFTKVASAVLSLPDVIGIYRYPTVLPSDYYTHFAEMLDDEQLPVPLWVHVGLYPSDDGLCAYTYGLEEFGSYEIEVLGCTADAMELYTFLMDLAANIITKAAHLDDGDTVSFDDAREYTVSVSDGVAVDGKSIKISYNK